MSDEYNRECCKCKTVGLVLILCNKCSSFICNDCFGKNETLCCNFPEPNVRTENVSSNERKNCKKCGNEQPICRICVKCNRIFKYFCVSHEDCWNIPPETESWKCLRCASTKQHEPSTNCCKEVGLSVPVNLVENEENLEKSDSQRGRKRKHDSEERKFNSPENNKDKYFLESEAKRNTKENISKYVCEKRMDECNFDVGAEINIVDKVEDQIILEHQEEKPTEYPLVIENLKTEHLEEEKKEEEEEADDDECSICEMCKNVQPICRTCSKCKKSHKFFCLGMDCWSIPAIRKEYFWLCMSCLPNFDRHSFFSTKNFNEISTTEAIQFIRKERVYNLFRNGSQLFNLTREELVWYNKFKKRKKFDYVIEQNNFAPYRDDEEREDSGRRTPFAIYEESSQEFKKEGKSDEKVETQWLNFDLSTGKQKLRVKPIHLLKDVEK